MQLVTVPGRRHFLMFGYDDVASIESSSTLEARRRVLWCKGKPIAGPSPLTVNFSAAGSPIRGPDTHGRVGPRR